MFALQNLLIVGALFAAMLAFQELGRQRGERNRRLDPEGGKSGYGATEGAVFGLLGLFIAFTFAGAGGRFEARRQLVVEEVNAIGTAWLRLDVLPTDRQPPLRDLFKRYLDARIETYRAVPDMAAVDAAVARSVALQQEIWSAAVAAAAASGQVPPATLLLPALNAMIDITTTRTAATRFHTSMVVFGMIGLLAVIGSLLAGYASAGHARRSWIHTVAFAAVLSTTLYVIIDLEYPRLGLVRVDEADRLMAELRQSMP